MTAKVTLNNDRITAYIDALATDIKLNVFVECLKAGAVPILNAYRSQVASNVNPGNKSFMKIWDAVDSKVKVLSTEAGAYLVVGTKRKGGQRLAPQALFGEFGAAKKGTVKRQTKGRGPVIFVKANRGIMPAQHWLAKAYAASAEDAKAAMMKKLADYVRRRA